MSEKRTALTFLCKLQMKIHLLCYVFYDIVSLPCSGLLTNLLRTKPLEMLKSRLANLTLNCVCLNVTAFFLPCGRHSMSPVRKFQRRFKSQHYRTSCCLSLPSRYIFETFSEIAEECLTLQKIQQISIVIYIWLHFLLIIS